MTADRRHPEALVRFGQVLRAARLRKSMSQDDLARACGLHATEISRLERGLLDARLSTIVEAAIGLGVEPGELMPPRPR